MTDPQPAPKPRPSWVWSNLSEKGVRTVDTAVQAWVIDYNRHLATGTEEIIPACWRQHLALAQELPVQAACWARVHRNPDSTPQTGAEYYTYVLPAFRARVPSLLNPDPGSCLAGVHVGPDDLESVLARAATDVDPEAARATDTLRQATFGSP